MEFKQTIYINGKPHNCTGVDSSFFADHESMPHRPCSQHRIGKQAALAIKQGLAVRTLGNVYSLKAPSQDAISQ